jgi:glycerophosphoryl diester phosphodiesterase
MKLIAHRGNVSGKQPDKENSPSYIQEAIKLGYDVEVDVSYSDGHFWLGHDEPQYETNIDFLKNQSLWCHAKDLEALKIMLEQGIHCFWHQDDDYTLTSKGFIWTYPNKPVCSKSVIVLIDKQDKLPKNCYGICSDYLIDWDLPNKARQR